MRSLFFLKLKLITYSENGNFIVNYLQKLYVKYIKKYLLQIIPLPLLDSVVIISLTCQCRCEHCGTALYGQVNKRVLTSREIMRLIAESKRLGVSQIYFLGGEALLDPQLPDYTRYAKQKGLITKDETTVYFCNRMCRRSKWCLRYGS